MGTVRRLCGDKDRSKGSKDSVMETLTTITTILAALVLFRTPFSNFILNSIPLLHTSTPFSSTDKRRRQN